MMEKLGAPQNHFTLKAMIGEVDEDQDEALVFREFLLIFRYAMQKLQVHQPLNTGCIYHQYASQTYFILQLILFCRKLFAGEFADRADDDGIRQVLLLFEHVLLASVCLIS